VSSLFVRPAKAKHVKKVVEPPHGIRHCNI
jgi:hypothetical protein